MSDAQSYFELPPKLTGNWLAGCSWDRATPDMLALCEKTKLLTALPTRGFAPQTTATVADAILLESLAPTNGVAVAVLQQCIAGTAGTQENLDRVRKRLTLIKRDCSRWAACQRSGPRRSMQWRSSQRPFSWRQELSTSRSSRWRNRPKPTPLAPRPRPLALVRTSLLQHRA